ncbi:cytochrome P450 4C1-like [Chrysoperla carnea]|uniref:cytochrome P450 4C1-like n=1 Tax=Chrysoperla carnea TaxID=189513 RepID=UPI001D08C45C|nr:cytochrome P450 4C1-like [Chrysoperla carnea]
MYRRTSTPGGAQTSVEDDGQQQMGRIPTTGAPNSVYTAQHSTPRQHTTGLTQQRAAWEIVFITIAVLILTFWIYVELPVRKIKKLTCHIPGPKLIPGSGLLIALYKIFNEGPGILKYFMQIIAQYGPVIRLSHVGRVTIVLTDVEDIEVVLRDAEMIYKPPIMRRLIKPWLGNGLLFSEGSYWKQQRKSITPTFHFNILEKFFEVFNEQGDILVEMLKEKADGKTNLDISSFMKSYALDVICETAMGSKMHSQTKLVQNDYVSAVYEIQRIFIDRLCKPLEQIDFIFPFTRNGRIQRKCLKVLNDKCDEIIRQRRKDLVEATTNLTKMKHEDVGTKKRLAFLDLLLHATNLDGTPLTNEQIRDEVASFTFAGHDTTSTQLSLFYYILSKHPDIQEEIYKEQCAIFMGENHEPTFKDVQEMQYLERTIKESQRLCTVVPFLSRQTHKDITLKTNGYVVPKGTMVVLFLTSLHRNPNIFPNPEKFDPDRFLPENIRKRNPFAFIPFGAGPRNCIGQKYAMLQMKTTTSKIIRNFKILPGYEENGTLYEPDFKAYIVLVAINGIKIRLVPRK